MNHPSSVRTTLSETKIYEHVLHGTLAFVNHACEIRDNIITCKPNSDEFDCRYADTRAIIKKGEEITAFYSKENQMKLCRKTRVIIAACKSNIFHRN